MLLIRKVPAKNIGLYSKTEPRQNEKPMVLFAKRITERFTI